MVTSCSKRTPLDLLSKALNVILYMSKRSEEMFCKGTEWLYWIGLDSTIVYEYMQRIPKRFIQYSTLHASQLQNIVIIIVIMLGQVMHECSKIVQHPRVPTYYLSMYAVDET